MTPLRFRESLDVHFVDTDKLFLLSENMNVLLDNPVAVAVARQVNGQRNLSQVVAALAPEISPMTAFAVTKGMCQAGYLMEGAPTGDDFAAYLDGHGLDSSAVRGRAGSTTVGIVLLDERAAAAQAAEQSRQALEGLGCAVTVVAASEWRQVGDSSLLVVMCDDYLQPSLREINEYRVATESPWLLTRPLGSTLWVGPTFMPGETGCWRCLDQRLTANRQVERYLAEKNSHDYAAASVRGFLPGSEGLIAGFLAREVANLIGETQMRTSGVMLSVDPGTLEVEEHALIHQPQCSACGDPDRALNTAGFELGEATATDLKDGGFRVCSPEETVARLEHHISPYLGAVSRLESLGVDTEGVTYSFGAGHNFAMISDDVALLRSNMRGQSGGKGRTEAQAKASAICEALERYCGVWSPQVPAVRGSFNRLRDEARVLHPHDSLLFSETQYDNRATLNKLPDHRLHRIPKRFDEDRETNFTKARSLTTGEEVLVPGGLIWYGEPDTRTHHYVSTDSNGGAAGNTLEEAILQGLCEVLERDSVALWWFSRVQRPAVDLDSFGDPYIARLQEFYAEMDRSLWMLDLTSDIGVPTFAALSRREHDVEDIMLGFGCHPDPHVAMFRSMTELNQFLPYVVRRDAQGNTLYQTDDDATLNWCKTVTLDTDPWLRPHDGLKAYTKADADATRPSARIDLAVGNLVERLQGAGVETLVVNQTRPDIDLSVVKVITPGLRHFWPRSAPGRLYDAPVAMGWLEEPLTEAQLNPRGVFF
ncbi:TOMM precursor leader peptide-binding protein [Propioniferax innocua]|uniref:Ribosomal protein S12 methylthiotransferase accessory factor n=1 Tax=Propioniferax innocua TaxID=1753 RepID=A0A542ZAF3_9ACTN|nr:TOMM precursor leader peptide-binding protein [Propioniferax innocua]TQL57329.1 ribosomal protein S12 methylthiotransferase accessory factor [Propioniferax innocua]